MTTTTTNDPRNTLEVTNYEALKSRNLLISSAKVVGGGTFGSNVSKKSTDVDSKVVPFASDKSILNVKELLPQALRHISYSAEKQLTPLINFLVEYYKFNSFEDLFGVNAIINSLYNKRNVDEIDYTSQETLSRWFHEFAHSFTASRNLKIDPRIFLKYCRSLYLEKGSIRSIEAFFKILYNEKPEVYFPWEDVLILSDGEWNEDEFKRISLDGSIGELKGFVLSKGSFNGNNGFLDDRKYIQDSYYYQQFSYDIKSEHQLEEWEPHFLNLIHPVGFMLFGTTVLLFVNTLNADNAFDGKMPKLQQGLIEYLAQTINLLMIGNANDIKEIFETLTFVIQDHQISANKYRWVDTYTRLQFSDATSIGSLADIPFYYYLNNSYDLNCGAFINQTEYSGSP